MAKISGYREAINKTDGRKFFVFDLTGAPVVSISSTGKMSVTVPRTSIPANSTSEDIVKSVVGMELPGEIRRVEVAAFEFTGRNGEKLTGNHRWIFVAEGQKVAAAVAQSAEVATAVVEDAPVA